MHQSEFDPTNGFLGSKTQTFTTEDKKTMGVKFDEMLQKKLTLKKNWRITDSR